MVMKIFSVKEKGGLFSQTTMVILSTSLNRDVEKHNNNTLYYCYYDEYIIVIMTLYYCPYDENKIFIFQISILPKLVS